jgi:hypothetical protein
VLDRKLNLFAPLRSSIWIGLSFGPAGKDMGRKPSLLSSEGLRFAGRIAISASPRTHGLRLEEYAVVPPAAATGCHNIFVSVHVSTNPTC